MKFFKTESITLILVIIVFGLNPSFAEFKGAERHFPKPFQGLGATSEIVPGGYKPDEGVETYDGISYLLFYKDDILPTRFVTSLTSNKNGDIFVGTKDIGVFKFSVNSSKRQWFKDFGVSDKKIAIHDMVYDEKNQDLYVATTAGVFRINDQPEFYDANCKLMKNFPEALTLALALDSSNGLWVGTSTGLYDPSGTFFSSKDGLPSNLVQSLKVDSTGNIWIGTDGGLVMKSSNTFHQINFGDTDKRWIYDLDQEAPIEMFISLERYEFIARAIFAGIRKNDSYGEHKEQIDAQMNKVINVNKPGKSDVIVAASDGLYRVDINSYKVTKIQKGWFNNLAFANTGQFYAINNEFRMQNFSPTTRLLGKFDLGSRLIKRLMGRVKFEISGEDEPDFLDENTIEEMQGKDDEQLAQALLPYIQNVPTTAMHFDKEGRLWIATDGGGLYYFSGRLNTSNFFVKSIAPNPGSALKKKRFMLQSEMLPRAEHSDLTEGEAACNAAHAKKFGYLPLKVWFGKTSQLRKSDWERIGKYIGNKMRTNDCITFLQLLPVDPWLFIPCIHLSDIPDLHSINKKGFADLSKETVDEYENYSLPIVPEDKMARETYPSNHPDTLATEGARLLVPGLLQPRVPLEFQDLNNGINGINQMNN